MRILVLGGTQFLGRYIVEVALKQNHDVTIFNRGMSSNQPPKGAQYIKGDRANIDNLNQLKGEKWDIVVDTCGYFPCDVFASSSLLRSSVDNYIFISSCSVYDSNISQMVGEEAKILELPEGIDPNERTFEYYGEKKLLCERTVQNIFGESALIIRPGLIIGPHDQSYRFPYWPERMNEGGEVLVPDTLDSPVQVIDVRDLADWIFHLASTKQGGVYNATGPENNMTLGDILQKCQEALGGKSTLVPISEDFLISNDVGPWVELPLWLTQDLIAMFMRKNDKALLNGLKLRPIEESIVDTLAWSKTNQRENWRMKALSREKEKKLVSKWKTISL